MLLVLKKIKIKFKNTTELIKHTWHNPLVHAFSCPVACGIWVPGSGIKPPSPTLADGLLTTGTREVPVF